MSPTMWLYFGIALILVEVMTPGLTAIFFGMAALAVALLVWIIPRLGTGWQWLLFSILSVASIVLLRRTLKEIFSSKQETDKSVNSDFVGKQAIVSERIMPERPGRIELNGTSWVAEAEYEIEVNTPVRIITRDNLTVKVELFKSQNQGG